MKFQVLRPATLLKSDSSRVFSVNFAKFLRTCILQNICQMLLLDQLRIRCIFSFPSSPFRGGGRV